jgi:hypothetical protein
MTVFFMQCSPMLHQLMTSAKALFFATFGQLLWVLLGSHLVAQPLLMQNFF